MMTTISLVKHNYFSLIIENFKSEKVKIFLEFSELFFVQLAGI